MSITVEYSQHLETKESRHQVTQGVLQIPRRLKLLKRKVSAGIVLFHGYERVVGGNDWITTAGFISSDLLSTEMNPSSTLDSSSSLVMHAPLWLMELKECGCLI